MCRHSLSRTKNGEKCGRCWGEIVNTSSARAGLVSTKIDYFEIGSENKTILAYRMHVQVLAPRSFNSLLLDTGQHEKKVKKKMIFCIRQIAFRPDREIVEIHLEFAELRSVTEA